MTRIITVASRKGGVNKTTTTVNLAYELSKKGQSVLVIDLDSQADATKYFSLGTHLDRFNIGHALLDRKFDIKQAIYPAVVKGKEQSFLFIVEGKSGDTMSKLNMDMMSLQKREDRLKMQLAKLDGEYDFILIDTGPDSNVLSMNAISASTEFILPCDFTENSIDGVEKALDHILDTQMIDDEEEINFLVLPCRINKSSKKSLNQGREYCAERFRDNTATTYIWERQGAFRDAESNRLPVSVSAPSSAAAMYYKEFAKEVLENVA